MERWLITYADMITLLLALFIIMYAVSTVDAKKFEAIAKSIREGFGATSPGGAVPVFESGAEAPFSGAGIRDSVPFEVFAYRRIAKVEGELKEFVHKLGGEIEVKYTERGIEISIFPSQILFDTASATLKPQFKEILRKLGAELVKLPNQILIEGHTDSRPIHTAAFPSNWELSAARAAAVLRFLVDEFRYHPAKLTAVGYADTRPVAPNDTPANMQRNRRVDIIILRAGSEAESVYRSSGASPQPAPVGGRAVPGETTRGGESPSG